MKTTFRVVTWRTDPDDGFRTVTDIFEIVIKNAFRLDGKMRAATIRRLAQFADHVRECYENCYQEIFVNPKPIFR